MRGDCRRFQSPTLVPSSFTVPPSSSAVPKGTLDRPIPLSLLPQLFLFASSFLVSHLLRIPLPFLFRFDSFALSPLHDSARDRLMPAILSIYSSCAPTPQSHRDPHVTLWFYLFFSSNKNKIRDRAATVSLLLQLRSNSGERFDYLRLFF